MTPEAERYVRLQELFEAAADLAPSERAVLHKRECAGDAALQREVEALVKSDAQAETFAALPTVEIPDDLFTESADEQFAGRRFGSYKLIRELGRGGLGTVYLAERADDEYRKEVALKLVRRGLDTEDILRRFRHERQILAQLDHPNIARLIDGGTTEDGRPYFVMEYVKGETVGAFCENHQLKLRALLELFRKVCAAVTYAHQNLVIHRDLKPSNILVTPEGEPKLLDFGIAKLLTADENAFIATVPALRFMTPDYSSPEQIRGDKITTASDVYSLGVVLFELLTGQKPYRLTSRTPEELSRAITDQEPSRPSALVSGRSKLISGDLDKIVLMAMRKEPERRFASVAELAEDLRRHLAGRPVSAQTDTLRYRARKFIGRNKVAVAAAVLVALSLFAGVIIALSQARRATEQARLARAERAAAEAARLRAEETSRFTQSFFTYANPSWYGLGQGRTDVTVREAMNSAARRLETELADQPEVRADLHHTIGEIYRVSGEYEKARQQFRESLALYRQVYGEEHPKIARAVYYLVAVKMGERRPGSETMPALREAIAMMRRTDPDNINLPHMLTDLTALILRNHPQENDLVETETLLREAHELFLRHYGPSHLATLNIASGFAKVSAARGDLVRAEMLTEENLNLYRPADRHELSYVDQLVDLAGFKLALGKNAAAESLFQEASEVGRKSWAPDDYRLGMLLRYISEARAGARERASGGTQASASAE